PVQHASSCTERRYRPSRPLEPRPCRAAAPSGRTPLTGAGGNRPGDRNKVCAECTLAHRLMIFDYQGPLDVPAYYIATPRGAYMLTAGPNRPAGPVVFTSTARLDAFLRYHRSRWGAIEGACAARLPIRL